ncbi:tyrosine-type recombinase/integrase [Nodosilinea sp. LEGE 07298]|uniref:tyrosine-type recombinase/integrase n=1 Tax=Nodosilinea sp. LEGE 07298 TaxID=2777970 RepID=UPI00188264C7|nr:tyrosine-type recombinase/integrase [Nodosilinea sp. LEGE 07298]
MRSKVGITSSHGALQLRFPWEGKRKYLSIGLHEGRDDRKLAQLKAQLLEHDLACNCVDTSFKRYRVTSTKEKELEKVLPTITLTELWAKYLVFKTPQVSLTTLDGQYKTVSNHLKSCPSTKPEQAIEIRDWLLSRYTRDSSRRTLVQLNACCRWAVQSKLITHNPFSGLANELRKNPPTDCRPFAPDETTAILKSFEGSVYLPIVKFLFLTGTRTGEARGIRWQHVRGEHLKICEALSGFKNRNTDTKTHRARTLPCNDQLHQFLQNLKPDGAKPEDLLFNVPSLRAFQAGWQRRVTRLTTQGLVTEYRSQYHTRHTFATNCLEAGIPIQQVAEWLGDSPETVLKHYAGVINQYLPPENL